MQGWKSYAYGSRITTYTRKRGDHVQRITNNAAHNAGTGFGLAKVKAGKAQHIGDYKTPQEAAAAADRLK